MAFRTDIALEAIEQMPQSNAQTGVSSGIMQETIDCFGFTVTKVSVQTEEAAKALHKPLGEYLTFDLNALIRREEDAFPRACQGISSLLQPFLPPADKQPVIVVGLGNRAITPDAIGPFAITHILATRHLIHSAPAYFADWRPVSAVSPGVLGQTGIEVGELICGLIDRLAPAAVIAIDALASMRLSRLSRTIQITNTGITPGSGVGNARFALTEENLGIPVIAIGVPTVVDGASLAHEIIAQMDGQSCEALQDLSQPHMITTRDIDSEVQHLSRVIGYAVNLALHPSLTISDIDLLLS